MTKKKHFENCGRTDDGHHTMAWAHRALWAGPDELKITEKRFLIPYYHTFSIKVWPLHTFGNVSCSSKQGDTGHIYKESCTAAWWNITLANMDFHVNLWYMYLWRLHTCVPTISIKTWTRSQRGVVDPPPPLRTCLCTQQTLTPV